MLQVKSVRQVNAIKQTLFLNKRNIIVFNSRAMLSSRVSKRVLAFF